MALIDRARDVYFDRAKERWKQEGFYADITDILEDYRAETNKKIKRDKVNVLSTFLISLYDYDHDSLQLDITKLIVLSPSREFPAKDYAFVGGSVNTYHMSDSIKRLIVNNIGSRPVTIDNVVYKHGINVTLVTEENHPEGLFSPDVFNGKGLFSNFIKKGDSNV